MKQVKTEVGIKNVGTELLARLERMGYRGRIISVKHVEELRRIYEDYRDTGQLDEEFSREWLNGFDFQLPRRLPHGSILLVAVPQPQVQVRFVVDGKPYPLLIPPTYHHGIDGIVKQRLLDELEPQGYRLYEANLPKKLLAVRSGLSQYGKNNITYIPGMGSYYRLILFASDMPATDDVWQAAQAMELCSKCRACLKSCPTGAIREDRFLLRAERCLTYHNERRTDFPDWIDPEWHHCLVGCMQCQWSCPENQDFKGWIVDGAVFTAEETTDLLTGKSKKELATETLDKVRSMYQLDYLEQLPRNLGVLLEKEARNADKTMA